jgi:hypothetical protein
MSRRLPWGLEALDQACPLSPRPPSPPTAYAACHPAQPYLEETERAEGREERGGVVSSFQCRIFPLLPSVLFTLPRATVPSSLSINLSIYLSIYLSVQSIHPSHHQVYLKSPEGTDWSMRKQLRAEGDSSGMQARAKGSREGEGVREEGAIEERT